MLKSMTRWELDSMDCMISVIMPALNEEDNIAKAVKNALDAFQKVQCSGEIVVVNDGSTDRTGQIVEDLIERHSEVRTIRHEETRGIGASFWTGVSAGRGEFVVLLPGDGETDAFEILRYLPLLNHVDIVIPFFYNKKIRTWKRRMISKIYKGIINLSFGLLINYMNGTVIYRKSILQNIDLKSTGFFYQTELLIKAIRQEYLYAEVPCALKQRLSGESKALSLRSLFKVIGSYFTTMISVYLFTDGNKTMAEDSVSAARYRELYKDNQ
jgi:glycosyltransferase involved in cell wall biosynthesis